MLSDMERLSAAFASRYQVEREIGAGGMATVYLARDLKHDREVALKVLRREVAAVLGAERFEREIAIAGRLTHPNILPMFDSGTVSVDGTLLPYYVMPYVPGESLRERLRRERQLPLEDTLGIVHDIGNALDDAHAQGIVHRDVKPENVLLLGDRAVLADFGIARAVTTPTLGTEQLTGTGIALGTPTYMSPERAAADPAVDASSDTYALAVITYEMLAGEPPFTGATPQAILARQITGEVLPLTTVRPHVVTAPMDAAIRRALAPAPADRFAHTGDFVAALQAGVTAPPVGRQTWHVSRRTRVVALGTLLVAIGIAAAIIMRDTQPPADGRLGVGVMPFRPISGASDWSETLPDLVSTFLDGTPGVRVVDPWALWRPLRPRSDARARSPDLGEADRLAKRAGVGRYVMGAVLQSGERLDLTLRIYGVGVSEPISTFTVNGSVDSAAQLAQRTAVEVLERVWRDTTGPSVPRMESVLTQSPAALKAYLAAREAMRRGLPDSANTAITRAITLDSAFALGLLEAVLIRSWVQSSRGEQYSGLRELAQRALVRADSMSARQRLRLEAMLASIETDGRRSAIAWQRLLERDSTDVQATNALSYVTVAYGWQFGADLEDALRLAERSVRIDSTSVPSVFRRALLAVASRDSADVRQQLERLQTFTSDPPLIRAAKRALQALLANDQAFAGMLNSLAAAPVAEWLTIFRQLRNYRPDRAVAMGELALRIAQPGLARNIALQSLASLLGAAGDSPRIDSMWAAGAFESPPQLPVRMAQRVLHTSLLGMSDSALTARALQFLSAYVPLDSALAYFDSRPVWSVSWSLGSWHAQRGDSAVARRWLHTIARFPSGGSPATWREALMADIESRLAARRGATDSARALAGRAYEFWTIHTENTNDADVEPALRYHYARSLLDSGMPDSAARILRSFVPPVSWIGSYVPLAHLALGGVAERAGNDARAAVQYDQALQLLTLGGPSVEPLYEEARAGLRRTAHGPVFRYGRSLPSG